MTDRTCVYRDYDTGSNLPPGNFIGTAAEHLKAVERLIAEARAKHRPVADLLKRQMKLKARCAALGAQFTEK